MVEDGTTPEQIAPVADAVVESPLAAVAEASQVEVQAEAVVEAEPVVIPPKAVRRAKPVRTADAPASAKVAPKRAAKPAAPKVSEKKSKKAPIKVAPSVLQLKDTIMATKQTTDFTEGFKDAFADVQTKAKEGYEKGTAALGEASEFAKGNVEAIVESGKILAAGLKEFGEGYAAEAKAAFEALSADAKELAAVKSPTDFFKLQGELARRSFDQAIAFGSKSSEAMLKLAGEAIVPISGRIGLAVAKAKKAA